MVHLSEMLDVALSRCVMQERLNRHDRVDRAPSLALVGAERFRVEESRFVRRCGRRQRHRARHHLAAVCQFGLHGTTIRRQAHASILLAHVSAQKGAEDAREVGRWGVGNARGRERDGKGACRGITAAAGNA